MAPNQNAVTIPPDGAVTLKWQGGPLVSVQGFGQGSCCHQQLSIFAWLLPISES